MRVASIQSDKLVIFYYLNVSEICLDKRGSLLKGETKLFYNEYWSILRLKCLFFLTQMFFEEEQTFPTTQSEGQPFNKKLYKYE